MSLTDTLALLALFAALAAAYFAYPAFRESRRRASASRFTAVKAAQRLKMTGHKTEAVYRRYAIVSEQDLREAAQNLATAEQLGKVLGKVASASG